jgi:hypothetical protein
MARQKVVIEFGADARAFNREMGNIKKRMGKFAKVGGAALAAAAAGYVKLMKAAVQYGDAIDKASARTGIGAEALQRLQFAAELSGANIDGLEKGIKRMSSVVLDVEDGLTESVRALDRLGVSLEDVKGKTPEDQLMVFMDALAGVEDASKRSALAQDIFGKAGTSLLPMLRNGSKGFRELLGEADKVNGVLSKDLIAGAAKLKDSFGRLTLAVKALAFREALSDAEDLSATIDDMSVKIAEFGEGDDFRNTIDSIRALASAAKFVLDILKEIIGSFVKIGEFVTKLGGQKEIDRIEKRFFRNSFGDGEEREARLKEIGSGTGQFGAAQATELDRARAMIRAAQEAGGMPVAPVGAGV